MRRTTFFLALLAILPIAGACGGGGSRTPADEVVTEGSGSGSGIVVEDPGMPSGGGGDDGGSTQQVSVKGSTATFELELRVSRTDSNPPEVTLILRNLTSADQTILLTDRPMHIIRSLHPAIGSLWPELHDVVTPYLETIPASATRTRKAVFPIGAPTGQYTIFGFIPTTDARVPPTLQLLYDLN